MVGRGTLQIRLLISIVQLLIAGIRSEHGHFGQMQIRMEWNNPLAFAWRNFVCLYSSNATNSQQPAVLLPSVFHWDANNVVFVTPIAELTRDEVSVNLQKCAINLNFSSLSTFPSGCRARMGMARRASCSVKRHVQQVSCPFKPRLMIMIPRRHTRLQSGSAAAGCKGPTIAQFLPYHSGQWPPNILDCFGRGLWFASNPPADG